MRYVLGGVLLIVVLMLPIPARAQTPITPEQALMRLFSASEVNADWFEPEFLAAAPVSRVQPLVASLRKQLGAVTGATKEGERYRVKFERGSILTRVALSNEGRFSTLILSAIDYDDPPLAFDTGVDTVRSLPGKVSLTVIRQGKLVVQKDPDTRLAIGSAFKLAVLAALNDQIEAGKHRWDEVVRLKDEWKSLPTGVLQNWPAGSPLTIETLATQMISISDNTATDALIEIVGREAIQAYLPGNDPMLSTRQLFMLKSARLSSLLQRWRQADVAGRRALLQEIDAQPHEWLTAEDFVTTANDVEWFVSTRDLCTLIGKVAHLDVFRVNSGGVTESDWQSVAFKGGSEPGVLNLTYQVTAGDGSKNCVSVTWNDAAAEADTLLQPVLQIIRGLK